MASGVVGIGFPRLLSARLPSGSFDERGRRRRKMSRGRGGQQLRAVR
jgi:hypothetical protein